MKSRSFALLISIFSGIAFIISTCTPIVVDPIIHRLIDRPQPRYLMGLEIAFFSIPLILAVFSVNNFKRLKKYKSLLTAILTVSAVFLSSLNTFGIHTFVLGSGLAYAFIITILVIIYDYKPTLQTDAEIAVAAKVERVKLEYETWFRILLAFLTFMAVPAGILVFNAYKIGFDIYAINGEITNQVFNATFIFVKAMWIAASYFAILVIMFVFLALKKIKNLLNELYKIKEPQKT